MNPNEITQIDKRFNIEESVHEEDIRFYDVRTAPVDLYGLYNPRTEKIYRRMPEDVAKSVSRSVGVLSEYTAGGRMRFKTDSEYVAIRCLRPYRAISSHMTFLGSSGFDVYEYVDGKFRYLDSLIPPAKVTDGYESVVHFGTRRERELLIHFPLYDRVTDLYLGLQEDATLTHGSKYTYEKPVVYYGSSVTEGGCACRPGTSDSAFLSRWLDFDFVNIGLSGSAKGEPAMAEYIAGLNMSVFVYDYDQNSEYEDLERTHWEMYKIIRKAQPKLPIIMASKKSINHVRDAEKEETLLRREAIRRNYEKAKAEGDDRVFFLDGLSAFAEFGEDECTVDGYHPTDLGFYAIAKAFEPFVKQCLTME
ncbi:MAG: hypothetical protein J6K84_00115 [Oscillospiraceae bacterium]|nr:hypothetical protein [Oscillospiraceae bacterium]